MLQDKLLTMGTAQSITTSAESENFIDLGAAGDAIGFEPYFICRVDTAAQSTGSSTVTISLQCDDNSAFSTPKTLYATEAIAKATLVANYIAAKVKLPPGCERYVRAYYTVATADLTAGKFDAFIVGQADINNIQ